jgi:uncharacterized membrane protein YeaQ/YmgE (transglycosylase-associated protein family)
MTLTAHAIVGASVASLLPSHPVLGFAAGFASHFLLDAIPHWDYKLDSMKEDKNNPINNEMIINRDFVKDILKVGFDGFVGFLLAYLIFVFYMKYSIFTILYGVVGAVIPDVLQFVQMKWRHEPLTGLRRFHLWIQKKKLNDRPALGIFTQIVIILFFVAISKSGKFF